MGEKGRKSRMSLPYGCHEKDP